MRQLIRRITPSVSLLLVVVLLGQVLLRSGVAQASAVASSAGPAEGVKARPERQMEQLLTELKAQMKQERPEKAKGRDLSGLRQTLAELDGALKREFRQTEQIMREKGVPDVALERHSEFVSASQSQLADLERLLGQVEASPTDPGRRKALLDRLEQVVRPEAHQPLGTGSLPYRPVQANPPAPSLGGSVSPAYAGGGALAAGGPLGAAPGPADLAETTETRQTAEIQALADQLGKDPVRLYEYVRNRIAFTPYAGSRKGAAETFGERTGNDWDQASLLIALLRAAGYPARYVTGTVEVPADQVMAWTGTRTPQSALELLASSGIPVTGMTAAGDYGSVRMEHTWVEAYLPMDDYRGVPSGDAERAWMPLDPSFKASRTRQGLDLASIASADPQAVIDGVKSTLRVDEINGGVKTADPAYLQTAIDSAVQRVQEYIQAHGLKGSGPASYLGGKELVGEELGVAPLALPFQTLAVTGEYTAVPTERQERVSFSLSGANPFGLNLGSLDSDLTWEATTAELAGQSLTLSWRPATTDDEAIIAAYGGQFATPAYLVRMVPELKVQGSVVAAGKPVGLGQQQSFSMRFQTAGAADAPVTNPVTVGAYYAVALDLGHANLTSLTAGAADLQQLQGHLTEQSVWTDEALGRYLHLIGQAYFGQVNAFRTLLAADAGIAEGRHTSEGIVAADLQVSYLFFSPVQTELAGLHIDVDRDLVSPVSTTGDRSAVQAYMVASGAVGSAFEHAIFEEFGQMPALSAIRVLQLAAERGVTIYTVDRNNVDRVLPRLSLSEAVKADIASAVADGKVVFTPEKELQYFDWHGAGYIVMDMATGAAGYIISGGWAGGSTAWKVALIVLVSAVLLGPLIIPTLEALIGLGFFVEGLVTVGVGWEAFAGAAFNGFMVMLFGKLAWDLAETAHRFWHGEPGAQEELILTGVVGVLAMGVGSLVGQWAGKAMQAVVERYPAVGTAIGRFMAWADTATYGTASRMVLQGWSQDTLMKVASQGGTEALGVLEALAKDGVATVDELSALATRGMRAQDLNTILRAGLTDLTAIGVTGGEEAALLARYLADGLAAGDMQVLAARGITLTALEPLGLRTAQEIGEFSRLYSALDSVRLDAAAWQKLADIGGANVNRYVADVLHMETAGVAEYGAVQGLLENAGIRSASDRALLRLRAQAGALTAADAQVLQEVTLEVAVRLEQLGASRATIDAVLDYHVRADILRLGYMDLIATAEATGKSVLAPQYANDIAAILGGFNGPADRAVMKTLPFDALPAQMQEALARVRDYWESQFRSAGTAIMHKEISEASVKEMILPGGRYTKSLLSGYWAWEPSVAGVVAPSTAYRELALGYLNTEFSELATERYYIVAQFDPVKAAAFKAPVTDDVIAVAQRLDPGTRMEKGFSYPTYPSTQNGHLASRTDFIPEWTWNGARESLPEGTTLKWMDAAGVLHDLAVVDRQGVWQKLIPWHGR